MYLVVVKCGGEKWCSGPDDSTGFMITTLKINSYLFKYISYLNFTPKNIYNTFFSTWFYLLFYTIIKIPDFLPINII